ncbi:MAG: hypothetical protein CMJ48_02405 [Planctomycetaceae bacterium]|nr:hypothetical protein [Planctomycetaceae bacterium]
MRKMLNIIVVLLCCAVLTQHAEAAKKRKDPKVKLAVNRALDYIARTQKRQGYWEANGGQYRIAMTALAANAMLCEGSTTTRGKYAKNIRNAVDYLVDTAQPTGLIGYRNDYHYTYGHGFSMLFLSQVYGEEEDSQRRADLKRVLTNAVAFSIRAQTSRGGWGYISAKDGNDFDEGSTCVTQVQGLRGCRNAGIPVPKEVIDRARKYIYDCMTSEGGIRYSYKNGGGSRPPITAAAVAVLFNAGDYDSPQIKKMLKYTERAVWPGSGGVSRSFGHWHYTHFYFSQVMYRSGEEKWNKYFAFFTNDVLRKQSSSGAWNEGSVGPIYTTAINATVLQLDNGFLPIYQR